MVLSLTVLGSGTVDPQPHRASSGFLLQAGEHTVLIDMGAGTLRNGQLAGLPMADIGTVVLTHFHPDHTSDLVPFLFARKYAPERWRECPPLKIYGPLGTQDFLNKLFAVWPAIEPEEGRLTVTELAAGQPAQDLPGGFFLTSFTAVHGDMQALCYRFEWQGQIVAFSGDTSLCAGVIEVAKGADLFICECACFPRGVEPLGCRQVHLSWEDVAEICEQALPKRLLLSHLYEVVLARKPDPLECLKGVLSIPVEMASDRAVFEI